MSFENFTPPEENNNPKNDSHESVKKYAPPYKLIVDKYSDECKAKCGIEFTDENKELLARILSKEKNPDGIYEDITDIIDSNADVNATLNAYLKQITGEQAENSNEQNKEATNKEKEERNDTTLEENNELKTRGKQFDELANSLSTLNGEGKDEKYKGILKRVSDLKTLVAEKGFTEEFDAEVKSILADLKANPETLRSIFLDLQQADARNGTHHFEAFRSSLFALAPEFRAIPLIGKQTDIQLGLGVKHLRNTQQTPNGWKHTTDDNKFAITLDDSDDSGRLLSHTDGHYSIRSDIGTTEARAKTEKINQEYLEVIKPINQSLASIDAMKAHIDSAKTNLTELDALKAELQALNSTLYNSIGLASMATPQELMDALTKHETKLTQKIDTIRAMAYRAIDEIISQQSTKAERLDANKKKMLEILHSVGLDFKEGCLEIIFKYTNNNIGYLGLSHEIDLANGLLGFDTDNGNIEKISDGEIILLLEYFTRGIFFNTGYSLDWLNGNVVLYSNEENAKAKIPETNIDIPRLVKQTLGSNPEITFIENLKASITKDGIIGSKKKADEDNNSEQK